MSQLEVSVIVPVYNGEDYILDALESIHKQTLSPFEILLVNDGSEDRTVSLVEANFSGVRVISQDNLGLGAARNRGVAEAHGEAIAFLDADDLWEPQKLAKQTECLLENNERLVFTHLQQFHSPELTATQKAQRPISTDPMPAELPSTMLCLRQTVERVGLFDTRWRIGTDVSWIMRARQLAVETNILPDVLYRRRVHLNNSGNTASAAGNSDRLQQIKAMLEARRDAES